MKIAIMGAADSVEKIYSVLSKRHRDIEFIRYKEDEIKKLIEMVKDIDHTIDGIFLTGIGVYSAISEKIQFEQPVVYTKRTIIGIIKAMKEFHDDFKNPDKLQISLDIIKEEELLDVLGEFEIEIKSYDIQKYEASKSEEDYLEYYLKKYENKETDCIFTSFGYIYNYLKSKGIPVYRIQATNIDIKDSFTELINNIKLKNTDERAVQIQIIQAMEGNSEALHKKILTYSREIEGLMQITGENEYLIVSNKGALLSQENISFLSGIRSGCRMNNVTLGIGIGEGITLYQSEMNARNALRKSIAEKKSGIYFYDGESVNGPIMEKTELRYRNQSSDRIKKLSKKIGISHQYIEKINAVVSKLGRDEFTSQELSEILLISERSANRILKKIIDSGYGKESNMESSLGAGRPRRKIKIKPFQ